MTSLALPKPKNISKWEIQDGPKEHKVGVKNTPVLPSYMHRKGFIPKGLKDFGDGGAYPEIHVVQYPLNMGQSLSQGGSGNLALETDASGSVRYDLVLHQGKDRNSLMQTRHQDLLPMDISEEAIARPSEEQVKETAERTRVALEKIVDFRIKSSNPKQDIAIPTQSGPTYIRYTPASTREDGSAASTRIIRMSEAPVDPFEPPKYKFKKVPRGPGSPPPPVMHSPPRKVSAEEQKNWVIPSCVSNWKNAKGYTIPLEKRLAADGRGLQQVTINDNFAKLSEALFIADRHAREEVKLRAEMQGKLASKEKKDKEEKLRMLAQKAREERAGLVSTGRTTSPAKMNLPDYGSSTEEEESMDEKEELTEREKELLKEREQVRKERAKQRERELRLSHMKAEKESAANKTKKRPTESSQRDISEKIALGMAQPTMSKESMFDSRLFNQSHGMSSGVAADDEYNLYDKPLFTGSSAAAIYRPKRVETEMVGGVAADRIEKIIGEGKPHKGFQGADYDADVARDGPVQFEKEADPFGFGEFMGTAKRGMDESDDVSSKKGRVE